MDKKTITVKVPSEMHHQLLKKIIDDGYGMKGKSKWVIEAVEGFIKMDYFPELVELADDMEQLSDLISVRVSEQLVKQLDEATLTVRKQYPVLEGVRSKLIRASILQRLIGNFPH